MSECMCEKRERENRERGNEKERGGPRANGKERERVNEKERERGNERTRKRANESERNPY